MAARKTSWLYILLLAALCGGALLLWRHYDQPDALDTFASGNGRIEATEVNLATKLAGRLEEVLVAEGDFFEQGQVLARMDTRTLESELRAAQAALSQAEHGKQAAELTVNLRRNDIDAAQALVAQCTSQLDLAVTELHRAQELLAQGAISRDELDVAKTAVDVDTAQLSEARAQLESAMAALSVAEIQVLNAASAVDEAQARKDTISTQIEDSTLTAPMSGRVLYRLAEPGEVMAAGGAVLTLLDIEDVYMTLFLPTLQAGRVALGAEARIVLDAAPGISIPARVSFVSPQAQFTPRSVETASEREKLMFRVKVRIDPDLLRQYAQQVKTGLPGVAYVRLDAAADWPEGVPPLVQTEPAR